MRELDLDKGQQDILKLLYRTQRGEPNALSEAASHYIDLQRAPAFEPEPEPTPPLEPPQAAKPVLQGLKLAKPRATHFEMLAPGKDFVEGMVRRGWTPSEAAGVAGNVHVESGFKPYIKSSVPGEQSYGLLQWNGQRLRGLQNYAQANGLDWTDPDTQMDWIHMERSGDSVKYGGTDERAGYRRALSGGGSPADIAERFGRFVERPLDLGQSVDLRRRAAEQYSGVGQTSES